MNSSMEYMCPNIYEAGNDMRRKVILNADTNEIIITTKKPMQTHAKVNLHSHFSGVSQYQWG